MNTKETDHDASSLVGLDSLRSDLRVALRRWRSEPGSAVVAVATFALAIAACTTVFSLIHAVLLRPLPFPEPGRLVQVVERNVQLAAEKGWASPDRPVSAHNYLDYRQRSISFDEMGWLAALDGPLNVTNAGHPLRVPGVAVSASLFEVLRVAPVLGSVWPADADRFRFEGPRVVLVSHGFWQRQLGGDPAAVGRTLRLDDWPHVVTGVLPAGFVPPPLLVRGEVDADPGLRSADLFVPLDYDAYALSRKSRQLTVVARLRPGVTVSSAQAELSTLASELAERYPEENAGWTVRVVSVERQLAQAAARPLGLITGAVGLLLLIACANVANLMLARSTSRAPEFAMRAALGASRMQVAREVILETLLLAMAGAIVGGGLAAVGVRWLARHVPAGIPRAAEASLDAWVLLFTLLVALLAALMAGLAPALRASSVDLTRYGRNRTAGGGAHRGVSRTLIVGETALALMLLFGAGLLTSSFLRLVGLPTGYDPRNLLVVELNLGRPNYYNARFFDCDRKSEKPLLWNRCRRREEEIDRFYLSVVERVERVPGVESAALISDAPLTDAGIYPLRLQLEAGTQPGDDSPAEREVGRTDGRLVYPGYFETMKMRLLAGRDFRPDDPRGWTGVAVVNATLARRVWPNGDALGARISFYGGNAMTVIGVVEDSLDSSLSARAKDDGSLENHVYHLGQFPYVDLMVRTRADPAAMIEPIRAAVLELDPELPVGSIRRLDELARDSNALPRFYALLTGLFATTAALLAAIGLYGVVAYSTGRRTREIGVRMALGADASSIRVMIVRSGLTAAATGLLLGAAGSLAVARALRAFLYGSSPANPGLFTLVAGLLLVSSFVASYLPSRRASRLPPVAALREE